MAKKKAPAPKLSEKDLAVHVVAYLERVGYTTYKEVALHGGGSDRADIYGVAQVGSAYATVSVETKTTFSIKVIEQAWQWVGRAHSVYIAVPAAKNKSERLFARDLCAMLGIGVMEVTGSEVAVTNPPLHHPNPRFPTLYEEQKNSVAGNADNEYVTPYKLTAARIQAYMEGRATAPIATVVLQVKHHYRHNASAKSALSKLIAMGVIEGLTMRGNNVVNKNHSGL